MRLLLRLLAVTVLSLPATVLADRGALTVGAGGGVSLQLVEGPQGAPVVGSAVDTHLEVRYALRHSLELELGGYYEPPATYYHPDLRVASGSSATLSHRMSSFGAHAGARLVAGMVWRPVLLAALGWAHQSISGVRIVDSSSTAISLADSSSDRLALLIGAGLEWVPGDNLAVSLVPRLNLLVGSSATWAITVPLVLSWSWYL